MLVREHIIDDNYYVQLLNENLITEEFNLDRIKEIVSNIADKPAAISRFIRKFNESRNFSARKYIVSVLIILFLTNFASKNNRWKKTNINVDKISKELIKEPTLTYEKVKNATLKIPYYIKPEIAHISDTAKLMIKEHETLQLKAYINYYIDEKGKKRSDGMITIGYGHAEPQKTSKLKEGQKITKERAEQLFNQDIKMTEDGVRRILLEWKAKGLDVKITQGMFDAMVSMAYNIGITRFRQTEFIQLLKAEKYKAAAERIKSTYIKNFSGLIPRREREYGLFTT